MLRSFLFVSLTACAVSAPALADVYRFKDEKGNILYTDKPSTLPAERLNIQSQKTDVVAAQQRQEAEMKRMQESASTTDQSAAQQGQEQQPAQQMAPKDKAQQCTKARERYNSYSTSQKLYEPLANGERRYLTSEEIDAARASAKATMDVMCK